MDPIIPIFQPSGSPASGSVVGFNPATGGPAWQAGFATQAASLQKSANLSDVENAATSRTNLGLGTAAAHDVGTASGNVVQLNGSAQLPAVDGSQLTNLPSGGSPGGSSGDFQYNDGAGGFGGGSGNISGSTVSLGAGASTTGSAYGTALGGQSTASAYASTASGYRANAAASWATALGGQAQALAPYSTALGPTTASLMYQLALAAPGTNTITTLQASTSGGGGATEMTSDGAPAGSANTYDIPVNTTLSLIVNLVARRSGGGGGSFVRQVLIQNTAGSAAIIGTPKTVGTDINTNSTPYLAPTLGTRGSLLQINVSNGEGDTTQSDWQAVIQASGMTL